MRDVGRISRRARHGGRAMRAMTRSLEGPRLARVRCEDPSRRSQDAGVTPGNAAPSGHGKIDDGSLGCIAR